MGGVHQDRGDPCRREGADGLSAALPNMACVTSHTGCEPGQHSRCRDLPVFVLRLPAWSATYVNTAFEDVGTRVFPLI
jgi:hypothetical protein